MRFYTSLGLKEIARYEHTKPAGTIVHLQFPSGGSTLQLWDVNGARPLPAYRTNLLTDLAALGTKHMAMTVESLDDAKSALKTQGVFMPEPHTGTDGRRYSMIQDPDGILVELVEVV